MRALHNILQAHVFTRMKPKLFNGGGCHSSCPNLGYAASTSSRFMGGKSIGKIVSSLGKPMMTYECTTKKLRVTYACVLVEIDITKGLKDTIIIRDPEGKKIVHNVEYKWKPVY